MKNRKARIVTFNIGVRLGPETKSSAAAKDGYDITVEPTGVHILCKVKDKIVEKFIYLSNIVDVTLLPLEPEK